MLTIDDLMRTALEAASPSTTTYKQKLLLSGLVRKEVCISGTIDDIFEEDHSLSVIVKSNRDCYTSFTKCIVPKDSQLRFLDKGERVKVKGLTVSVDLILSVEKQYKIPRITVDCRFNDSG